MGLTLSTGRFSCTGETQHFFDQLPGETVPAEVPQEVAEANRLEPEPEAEAAPVTQEVKDAEENRIAEINSQLSAPAGFPPDHEKVFAPPVWRVETEQAIERGQDWRPGARVGMTRVCPIVGVGESAGLPGGDVLIGIRVPETWIGPMQSEAESRQPPISLAEYVQELVDLGLLSYYGNEMVK